MIRILIIKLGSLGDVLRTTCILPGLHEKYPDALIVWLASSEAIPLLIGNPLVNEVLDPYSFQSIDAPSWQYDLVINLDDDLWVCEFAASFLPNRLIGAYALDGKIDYTDDCARWFDMGLISRYGKEQADKLKKENRETFPNLLFEALDISRGNPSLVIPDSERNFAHSFSDANFPKNQPVIGLNTGAGTRWRYKQLSLEKTAALIDLLNDSLSATLVLFGGKNEHERNQKINSLTNHIAIDSGHHNTLLQFSALIERCDLLITSDSLALHVASCLRIPVIVFFGPTSKQEIQLFSPGTKLAPKMDCLCCYKRDCDVRPTCMDNISIGEILNSAKNLLQQVE